LWSFSLGHRLVWYVGRDIAEEGAASCLHPEDVGSVFLRNTARCHRSENPESLKNDLAALRCIPSGQTVWGIFRGGFRSFGTRRCLVGWMVSDVSNERSAVHLQESRVP